MTSRTILNWVEMNPKRYYKDGKIQGLMSTKEVDGVTYIGCMADGLFTYNMIKDIIMLYETRVICLIVDTKSEQELIRRALSRYSFRYEYRDDIMYAIGDRLWVAE